jgi:hypothetical protein
MPMPNRGAKSGLAHEWRRAGQTVSNGTIVYSKWVKVPTFDCCSENGSITAGLLTDMLKTIDGYLQLTRLTLWFSFIRHGINHSLKFTQIERKLQVEVGTILTIFAFSILKYFPRSHLATPASQPGCSTTQKWIINNKQSQTLVFHLRMSWIWLKD